VLNNPGIVDFRDPKVFWSDEFQKWVMILAVKDHVSLYSSPNLIDWTFESDFGSEIGAHGGVWECPDLFILEDKQSGEEKWVMLVSINPGGPNGGSATQYFMGDFDGKKFIPEDTKTRWLDYGTDNYAGVTWANVPEKDGRRLFIGWMNNWLYANVVPTQTWRGAMTIPRELVLEAGKLKNIPVRELSRLRDGSINIDLDKTKEIAIEKSTIELILNSDKGHSDPFDIIFSNDQGEELRIQFRKDSMIVDRSKSGKTHFNEMFSNVHEAPLRESLSEVRILLDVASLEVFVNDGTTVMTEVFFPNEPLNKIHFDGNIESLSNIKGYYLKSIWK
jgi:fructan beta-fructosidase